MVLPFDPNDGTFLSSVFISADEQALGRVKDVLAMMGIPNPNEDEFFSGNNADRLHLNKHGLSINAVYRRDTLKGTISRWFGLSAKPSAPVYDARNVVDDRILQPLYREDISPYCSIEINPGIYSVGADRQTVQGLVQDLKKIGVHFYAPQSEFTGEIRHPSEKENVPSVINRRAIKLITSEAGAGEAQLQERTFGDLREKFSSAFKTASGAAMDAVLRECARIVALPQNDTARILNPHWMQDGPDTERRRDIRHAARKLQRRMYQ